MENFTPIILDRPKNLKATMAMLGAARADIYTVHPSQIKFLPEFNIRVRSAEYKAHLQNIKESILANGFYPDKGISVLLQQENGETVIYACDGHTRTEAVLMAIAEGAPIEGVPIIPKPAGTTIEDVLYGMAQGNTGKPNTVYERAINIKRLVDMGQDIKVVAKRMTLTVPYVQDLLSLMAAPKKIRDLVAEEKVTVTTAIKELTDHGPKLAMERLTEAVKTAQDAGKDKVTPKHLPKAAKPARKPTVKMVGTIGGFGKGKVTMNFDFSLEQKFSIGDKVKLVLVAADDEEI